MTPWRRVAGCAAGLGLVLAAPPAAAQTFRAVVRDSATDRPLEGAILKILDSTGATLAQRETDPNGVVTGEIFGEATVFFAVLRIGYRPFLSQPVAVGPGQSVTLGFALRSRALALPDLEVRAFYHPALEKVGFADREREGFGAYLGPEDIERAQRNRSVRYVADLLTNIPGVLIAESGVLGSARTIRLMAGSGGANRPCGTPKVYIDGFRIDGSDLESAIMPSDILAAEVYRRPVEIPPQYGGSDAACGVILIWSRRGLP